MVREFAIGFGPKILGFTKEETLYTIRLLPLGGYVRMAGEDLDTVELQPGFRLAVLLNKDEMIEKIYLNQNKQLPDMLFLEVEKADLEKGLYIEGYDEDERPVRYRVSRNASIVENGKETLIAPYDRQFGSKSVGKRSMTIFAGPLFNFILAFFLFLILGLWLGVPTYEPVISDVTDNSPAKMAGMEKGDLVTSINGNPIESWDELSGIVQKSAGQELSFEVLRDGEPIKMEITPEEVERSKQKVGQIGVLYESPREYNPLKAVAFGAEQTIWWMKEILRLLGTLVTGQFTIDALSGPVGIYKATEEVAKFGVASLMNWAAVLSINLGIMNLLPLPALDGGRLLFFGFEAVRGKPVDRQKEGMVHFVGIMLLMVLMIIVTWNDIQRFFF